MRAYFMRSVQKKEVRFYETREGRCPCIEWRNSLDTKIQAIVAARISRLEMGNVGCANRPGEGVHELKIDFGPGFRIYFGNTHGTLVIILMGGSKKHQKRDILQAKIYWSDWKILYWD